MIKEYNTGLFDSNEMPGAYLDPNRSYPPDEIIDEFLKIVKCVEEGKCNRQLEGYQRTLEEQKRIRNRCGYTEEIYLPPEA